MSRTSLPISVLALILASILALAGSVSTTAATIQVAADLVVVAADGQCSLREAIHNANADAQVDNGDCPAGDGADTIVLASGGQYVIADADPDKDHNGLPVVTTEIVVEGNGATIERDSGFSCVLDDSRTAEEFRILEVDALADLTLEDLALRGGCADGSGPSNDGGALRVANGTLTLTRVLVEQNSALDKSGGLDTSGASVAIVDSTFRGNHGGGGAGAIGHGSGTMTIERSTISGNTSGGDGGGGIGNFDTLILRDSTISGNSSTGDGGGGIGNLGTMQIDHCTIVGNSVTGALGGGGIANAGSLEVKNSIVADSGAGGDCLNIASFDAFGQSFDTDGSCEALDSGHFSQVASANIDLGLLAANGGPTQTHALGPASVALEVDVVLGAADEARSSFLEGSWAGLPDVTSPIVIGPGMGGSSIARDPALGCDVADGPDEFRLLQVVGNGALTLEGVTLANGCADRGGAILVADSATLTVDATILTGNTARSAATAQGGAIWAADTASMTISGALFRDNLASGSRAAGGALWDAGALSSLTASRFIDNEARSTDFTADAGAAYLNGAPALSQVVFQQNVARGGDRSGANGGGANGGALFLVGDGATIRDTLFLANLAQGGDSDLRGGSAEGGALETDGPPLGTVLERVTFASNRAEGGAGGSSRGGDARAGAVLAYNVVAVDTVTFSENVSAGGDSLAGIGGEALAGAVLVDTADVPMVVEGSTFFGNQAIAGSGGAGDGTAEGGGLHARDDGATVAGSLFESNTTTMGATTSDSPCFDDGVSPPYVTSLGFNTIAGTSPDCIFAGPADQTDVGPSLRPLGDHGCTAPLPDGSCLPTHPVDLAGPAIDQGSCTASGATTDGRGLSRPVDLAAANNADDGCDAGAYESRDDDVDDVEDSLDNCPADSNPGQEDVDLDRIGDACDLCEGDNATGDGDGDGICLDRDCDDGDGLGNTCWLFGDGFETGDLSGWSKAVP